VCYNPPAIESVPIVEAVNRLSVVDPVGSPVQAARALGISFGDCPHNHSPFQTESNQHENQTIINIEQDVVLNSHSPV
jgi:hypothetical protein